MNFSSARSHFRHDDKILERKSLFTSVIMKGKKFIIAETKWKGEGMATALAVLLIAAQKSFAVVFRFSSRCTH